MNSFRGRLQGSTGSGDLLGFLETADKDAPACPRGSL